MGSCLAQVALLVGLPDLPCVDVQGCQPAAAVAIGVDANQVAQVEDLAGLLRRVPSDHRLARNVWAGIPSRSDSQRNSQAGWSIHRQVGVVLRMDEDVRVGFVPIATALEERRVLGRDPCQLGLSYRSERAPYDKRVGPPPSCIQRENVWGRPARASRSIWSWLPKSGTRVHCASSAISRSITPRAVRTAVDVITQCDDQVVTPWLDRLRTTFPRLANNRGCHRWRSFETA